MVKKAGKGEFSLGGSLRVCMSVSVLHSLLPKRDFSTSNLKFSHLSNKSSYVKKLLF
jgi:hypothetical protein